MKKMIMVLLLIIIACLFSVNLVYATTYCSTKDTFINSQTAITKKWNMGIRTNIEIDGDKETRSLIYFPLSGLSGKYIATLSLIGYSGSSTNWIRVHLLTTDWEEGTKDSTTGAVNWLNTTNSVLWSTEGGDYTTQIYGAAKYNSNTINIDISEAINSISNGTYTNYGFLLESNSTNQLLFYSREYSSCSITLTLDTDTTAPTITLVRPSSNNTYIPNTTYNFGITTSDSQSTIDQCILEFNYTTNYTMDKVGTSCNASVSGLVNDLNYTFRYFANDTWSNMFISGYYNIFIDNVTPQINLTYPLNTTYLTVPVWLNYTASDLNLNKCWYNTGGANSTPATCNNFSVTANQGSNLYKVYVNDSANNVNSSNVTFYVDSISPYYQDFIINDSTPKINGVVKWNVTLLDNLKLDSMLFAHNNTASFVNSSATSIQASTYAAYNTQTVTLNHFNKVCGIYWFNDTLGNFNMSTQLCYTVSNTLPVITSPASIVSATPIDTDDLNCTNLSTSDENSDTVTLIYDWQNGSTLKGINSRTLDNGNTTPGESWSCSITAYDGYNNGNIVYSGSVIIGGGSPAAQESPSINWTNATTSTTGINSTYSNPTNNNSYLNFSLTFNDVNSGDRWTAYFCKGNTPPILGVGCPDGTYCNSTVNSTSYPTLSCLYTIDSSITSPLTTYYSFILDNNSGISATTTGTFYTNFYPTTPTLVSPSNGAYINVNYSLINFSATDVNGDTINYTIYNSTDGVTWSILNSSNQSYSNMTNLIDGVYFIKASSIDNRSYSNNINSSVYNFTIDTTQPDVNITSPTEGSTVSTASVLLSVYSNELHLSSCNYTLYLASPLTPFLPGGSVTCNGSVYIDLIYDADYILYASVTDLAGNMNTSNVSFTRSIVTVTPPAGGGGTPIVNNTPEIKEEVKKAINETGIVGDGICSPEERAKGPLFSSDCPPDFGEIKACFIKTEGVECAAWFFAYSGVFIALIIGLALILGKKK